jgi:hypothetical protein
MPASNIHTTSIPGRPAATLASGAPQIEALNNTSAGSTFTWGKGGDTGGKINYNGDTTDHKLHATVVLKPRSGYTFKGFALTDSTNKTNVGGLFQINSVNPVDVALSLDSNGNLVATLGYVIAPKPFDDTDLAIATTFRDFTAVVGANNPIASVGTFGLKTGALVGISAASWTDTGTGGTPSAFGTGGSAVYTFTLTPVSGYTFTGSSINWVSHFAGLTGGGTPVATGTPAGDTLVVTLTYTL